MICAEFENLLSDYVDGSLAGPQRTALNAHAANCAACEEFLRDVMEGQALLSRLDEVLPPADLVTRIAYQAPMGRVREPLETQGTLSRLFGRWLQPVIQPRFAMGMAMTILSFAMLEKCTGVQVQHLRPADLSPARVVDNLEDKLVRTKDRAVKYYENLRLVYEIETRLRDLQDRPDAAPDAATSQKQPTISSERQSSPDQQPAKEGGK